MSFGHAKSGGSVRADYGVSRALHPTKQAQTLQLFSEAWLNNHQSIANGRYSVIEEQKGVSTMIHRTELQVFYPRLTVVLVLVAVFASGPSIWANDVQTTKNTSIVQSITERFSDQFTRLKQASASLVEQPSFQWSRSHHVVGPRKFMNSKPGKFVVSFKVGWLGDFTIEDGPIVGFSISISRDQAAQPKTLSDER